MITIKYGQVDTEAKADSNPISTDKQYFSDILDLKLDNIEVNNFMTCEWNYNFLDGTLNEFPNEPTEFKWGLFTSSISNEKGLFMQNPILDMLFYQNHKSNGLTLFFYPFSEDYANKIRVTWFDSNNEVIFSNKFNLESNEAVINKLVIGFRRIKIEFLSTNNPYRYIKLWKIEYGRVRTFKDEEIDNCSILEEVDPTCDVLSINTLNFDIKTNNPVFSLINGDLGDTMLMKKQQLEVRKNNTLFGMFFLETWEDTKCTGTNFSFSGQDALGVLDNIQFLGGMYQEKSAKDLLEEIITLCFPTQIITLDYADNLINKAVSGYIPITTCKNALQLICFSIGAIVDTSRGNKIKIFAQNTEISQGIGLQRLYLGGKIKPFDNYYNGVDITVFDYQASNEDLEAFNGELDVGEHLITFSEPLHDLNILGAVILKSNVNFAKIQVNTSQNIILTGKKYIENKSIFSIRDSEIMSGEVESLIVFDNCTLVSNTQDLLDKLLAYYMQRITLENDVILEDLKAGDLVKVATYGRPVIGTVEKLNVNLRSNRANFKVVGTLEELRPHSPITNTIHSGEKLW